MSRQGSHQGRIFWGLVLVILGTLFLLDRISGFDFGYLISRYWPVIFIVLGLSMLIGSGFRQLGPGFFFIVFGVFFLLAELDILEYNAWHYLWPAVIIVAGLWLLLRPRVRPGWSASKFPEIKDSDIDASAILSAMKRRIESQNFRGGRLTAVLGGMELDFTRAGLEGGKATIDATAMFGGIDIRVPRDWKVVMDVTPILGGAEDKHVNVSDAEAKATLFIRGTAMFGGITVKD